MSTTTERGRALVLAALFLAIVTALAIRLSDPPAPPPHAQGAATVTPAATALPVDHPQPTRTAEAVPTGTRSPTASPSPRSADPEALPTGTPEDRRLVRQAAAIFVRAFSAYEVGANTTAVKAGLRGTASPELASTLLAAPPRRIAGRHVERARLTDISDLRVDGDRGYVLIALRRGARPDGMTLQLQRYHGRFYVVRID